MTIRIDSHAHVFRRDLPLTPGCLLDAVNKCRTLVKLSAPYRLGGADPRPYAQALLDADGGGKLVWASDWPWTQNDEGLTYPKVLRWLEDWVPDAATRARILGDTPRALFRFDA